MIPLEQKNLSRFPQAITNSANYKVIQGLYELSGNVGIDILLYVAKNQLTNLFGENWFSIDDFCKQMNYNKTNLQRKISEQELKEIFGNEKPIYFALDSDGKPTIEHKIETIFEATLYKLSHTNLTFVYPKNGVSVYNSIQIIDQFSISSNFKTQKRTKRLYSVKMGSKIKDSLFSQYNLLNKEDYTQIPNRQGYKRFYLFLVRMICLVKHKKEVGELPVFTMSVDELAELFSITRKENRQRKANISKILENINERLTVPKFRYEYIKGKNQKFAYTVKFDFPQATLNYFEKEYNTVFTNGFHSNIVDYYIQHIAKTPYDQFSAKRKAIKSDIDEEKLFLEWFYSDQDFREKQWIYVENFKKAFGVFPEDLGMKSFNSDSVKFSF